MALNKLLERKLVRLTMKVVDVVTELKGLRYSWREGSKVHVDVD